MLSATPVGCKLTAAALCAATVAEEPAEAVYSPADPPGSDQDDGLTTTTSQVSSDMFPYMS
jgi:hypothetical protein